MVADLEHIPVLLRPTIDGLCVSEKPDGVFLDCTFGRGGHSRLLLSCLGQGGRLYALDRDPQAVSAMSMIEDSRFAGRQCAFADLEQALDQWGLDQV
ncbi:MAG TPA: 16S rRNA (cytosine(1402)-N(4))-methyltransferase, partial [Allocoleopsis sp.]